MDDDCNHGKDDYSDIQDRALGVQCVLLMRKQTVCMCTLGALISTSYFCLNTASVL